MISLSATGLNTENSVLTGERTTLPVNVREAVKNCRLYRINRHHRILHTSRALRPYMSGENLPSNIKHPIGEGKCVWEENHRINVGDVKTPFGAEAAGA